MNDNGNEEFVADVMEEAGSALTLTDLRYAEWEARGERRATIAAYRELLVEHIWSQLGIRKNALEVSFQFPFSWPNGIADECCALINQDRRERGRPEGFSREQLERSVLALLRQEIAKARIVADRPDITRNGLRVAVSGLLADARTRCTSTAPVGRTAVARMSRGGRAFYDALRSVLQ